MTEGEAKVRLAFASKYRRWLLAMWGKKIIWSDETSEERGDGSGTLAISLPI